MFKRGCEKCGEFWYIGNDSTCSCPDETLAQPEQEPVAWVRDLTSPSTHCVTSLKYLSIADTDAGVKYIPVYTAPPSKPWIGLDNSDLQYQTPHDVISMRYAEALLKEKNNG